MICKFLLTPLNCLRLKIANNRKRNIKYEENIVEKMKKVNSPLERPSFYPKVLDLQRIVFINIESFLSYTSFKHVFEICFFKF